MAANDNQPPNRRSLRQGLAALANASDHMAAQETDVLLKLFNRRLTARARQVARREPLDPAPNLQRRQQQNLPDQQ